MRLERGIRVSPTSSSRRGAWRRPTYDFNYCLMSLFLLCLFGTRFSIFSCSPLPPLVVQIRAHRSLGNRYVWHDTALTSHMFEQDKITRNESSAVTSRSSRVTTKYFVGDMLLLTFMPNFRLYVGTYIFIEVNFSRRKMTFIIYEVLVFDYLPR